MNTKYVYVILVCCFNHTLNTLNSNDKQYSRTFKVLLSTSYNFLISISVTHRNLYFIYDLTKERSEIFVFEEGLYK